MRLDITKLPTLTHSTNKLNNEHSPILKNNRKNLNSQSYAIFHQQSSCYYINVRAGIVKITQHERWWYVWSSSLIEFPCSHVAVIKWRQMESTSTHVRTTWTSVDASVFGLFGLGCLGTEHFSDRFGSDFYFFYKTEVELYLYLKPKQQKIPKIWVKHEKNLKNIHVIRVIQIFLNFFYL